MFCPICSARVVVLETFAVTPQGPTVAVAAVCVGCSMVSEVRAGQLIDLGRITLEDLECPNVPGIDAPHVFIQAGSTLLWLRRES